jgi:hypothetical protein
MGLSTSAVYEAQSPQARKIRAGGECLILFLVFDSQHSAVYDDFIAVCCLELTLKCTAGNNVRSRWQEPKTLMKKHDPRCVCAPCARTRTYMPTTDDMVRRGAVDHDKRALQHDCNNDASNSLQLC